MEDEYMPPARSNAFEYFKFALVITGIILLSIGVNSWFGSGDFSNLMRWFMGIFFVTFGTFKFIGYEDFVDMFGDYDLIASRFKAYSYLFPFLELFLGVTYLLNLFPTVRDVFTFVLMSIGAVGVILSIRKHGNIQCACLGNVIRLPLSTVSLAEYLIMAAMALYMLVS